MDTEKRKKLLEELKGLDNELSTKLETVDDGKLKLERLEYTPLTDDEITTLAKESFESKYATKKQNVTDETASKKLSFLEALENAQKQAKEDKVAVESAYKNAKDNVEDQALKRGMARSSVVVNQVGELEKGKQAHLLDIKEELDQKVNDINDKIVNLELELSKSLKDLDMEKAIEINEKIIELRKDEQAKKEEIIKYNNSIEAQETQYNNSYVNNEAVDKREKLEIETNRAKVAAAVNYYSTFNSEEEALQALRDDDEVRNAIGNYYEYLVKAIKASY